MHMLSRVGHVYLVPSGGTVRGFSAGFFQKSDQVDVGVWNTQNPMRFRIHVFDTYIDGY